MEKRTDHILQRRVLLIDLLRVVAISMILFSHVVISMGPPLSLTAQPYVGIRNFYWATWGEIGVTIFLIVSGLSLEYSHGHKRATPVSFYLRRIIRIYPTYFMSLLVALLMQLTFSLRAHIVYGEPFNFLSHIDIGDFILTITGFNAFAGKWGGTLIWSSWFIGLIMTMYLFYPIVSSFMKTSPILCIVSLGVISGLSRLVIGRSDLLPGNAMEWFPLNRLFEFGMGIFLMRIVSRESLLRFNASLSHIPLLTFLGSLSFPLFLIHDPLRRFINLGSMEMSFLIGIPLFLALSVSISEFVHAIDKKIQAFMIEHLESALKLSQDHGD